MEQLAGKTILITGGTGSFGRAVVSRLLETDVKEVRIFSRDELKQVLKKIDVLILNDTEAKALAEKSNLISAAKTLITEYGLERVVVKKGEHGAISLTEDQYFSAPAYPLEAVIDPTGAGDSFNAGFLHKYLQGAEWRECLNFGNACGALAVTALGGTEAFRDKVNLHKKLSDILGSA